MKPMSLSASIVVLAWNGMPYLERCLDAVLRQDDADFEVVVVDNGSADGSADFVSNRFPTVKLIRLERNLGYAAGNNAGLRVARGDALVLLNQDTEVRDGWLRELIEPLSADPHIGIAGSKALYPDGSIQHAGGHITGRGETAHDGNRQRDAGQFDQLRDVDYVTGASLAISRRAMSSIGALDEAFQPAYFEDVDWCFRARLAGFRVVVAPRSVLVHHESSVGITHDQDRQCQIQVNRLRLVLKHWPLEQLTERFLAAETDWLMRQAEGGVHVVATMHRAYLRHLLNLSEVVDFRRRWLGDAEAGADTLAWVLLQLRAAISLQPARAGLLQQPFVSIDAHAAPIPVPAPDATFAEVLALLRQQGELREHEFRSDAPVVGRLVAALRRAWNDVSTRWYVWPVMQQQAYFNANAVDALNKLAAVLAEYISADGREMAELAVELRRVKDRLRELEDARKP